MTREAPVGSEHDGPMPSLTAFMPRAIAAASPSQLQSYTRHWRRACDRFGELGLDQVRASDITALQRTVVASGRGGSRGGRYAGESAVRAMRVVFRMAEADGWIDHGHNPAALVKLPRRLPSTRRGLTRREIAEVNQAVAAGGRDPALDCLLVCLHLETACRRGGALGLRLADLDVRWCRLRLREKGGTVRWQPISPTLTAALVAHARARGVLAPGDALLRRADGSPLSPRHYETLWARVRSALPWADALGISAHWLRHTTITWVERCYGYSVARAYAGHTDTASAPTATFAKARTGEIAAALSALTGEPHPLAALEQQENLPTRRVARSHAAAVGISSTSQPLSRPGARHLAIAPEGNDEQHRDGAGGAPDDD
ncbi:MAG: tyrosine-type recombinase/integrase [Catenulispora sp.]